MLLKKNKMKLLKHGPGISENSYVTNISSVGFWLIIGEKEYFVSFSDYPEFKKASVDKIFDLKMISPIQLRWDLLDIDIELGSLESPKQFPLVFKA